MYGLVQAGRLLIVPNVTDKPDEMLVLFAEIEIEPCGICAGAAVVVTDILTGDELFGPLVPATEKI